MSKHTCLICNHNIPDNYCTCEQNNYNLSFTLTLHSSSVFRPPNHNKHIHVYNIVLKFFVFLRVFWIKIYVFIPRCETLSTLKYGLYQTDLTLFIDTGICTSNPGAGFTAFLAVHTI